MTAETLLVIALKIVGLIWSLAITALSATVTLFAASALLRKIKPKPPWRLRVLMLAVALFGALSFLYGISAAGTIVAG